MKRSLLTGIAALILLTGCDIKHQIHEDIKINYDNTNSRFSLELVQSFYDSKAYNSDRGVYILKDKQTGKEYVGISGVGITELGSHTTGKTTTTDER